MHRPGRPEDIACAALYFASPASAWVTGKVLQVDGGTERPRRRTGATVAAGR
jgi:7-alpha-hydroxysteroid dehydrogenase